MLQRKKYMVWFRELFPFTFVVLLWLIHLTMGFLDIDNAPYALYPRSKEGLLGILTAPLLHADLTHLFSNSIPLLVCGFLLFHFYKPVAWKVWIWSWLLTGVLVWLVGRNAWHLGASGLVYGLTAFLLFSGFIRRHYGLMLISLLIIFLYGSFIWGMFPFDPSVSWESHLCGGLTGVMTAWLFRKEGPQRIVHEWPEEEEENNTELPVVPEEEIPSPPPLDFTYTYIEKKSTDDPSKLLD